MARPCIELNLENATLAEVRVAMDCTPTKKGFRRLQALLWLYEGKSREEVETQVQQIAALLGTECRAHDVLYSSRILKKTGLRIGS